MGYLIIAMKSSYILLNYVAHKSVRNDQKKYTIGLIFLLDLIWTHLDDFKNDSKLGATGILHHLVLQLGLNKITLTFFTPACFTYFHHRRFS
jgi:hypothetical protein